MTVASFNVLNYFTTIDDGGTPCAGGCRGAERSGPPEPGTPLEERRVRRVGDGAGPVGAARGDRTRPPHALSVHG